MCVFIVFSNIWELWRQGCIHHLPALIFHFTAKTSAGFSIFFFFLLNFLPVSVSLIHIQHLGLSCAAFLRVAGCCFDLFLGCVKQTNAGAAPPAAPPIDAVQHNVENQLRMLTSATFIWPPASNRVYRFRPPPPHPNQVTSYFPAVSERGSDATWPNHPDGWAAYALIYSCVYSSTLPSPFSETKKVLSRYIRCDLGGRHNLWLHLWNRNSHIPRKHVAKSGLYRSIDMFIILCSQ